MLRRAYHRVTSHASRSLLRPRTASVRAHVVHMTRRYVTFSPPQGLASNRQLFGLLRAGEFLDNVKWYSSKQERDKILSEMPRQMWPDFLLVQKDSAGTCVYLSSIQKQLMLTSSNFNNFSTSNPWR